MAADSRTIGGTAPDGRNDRPADSRTAGGSGVSASNGTHSKPAYSSMAEGTAATGPDSTNGKSADSRVAGDAAARTPNGRNGWSADSRVAGAAEAGAPGGHTGEVSNSGPAEASSARAPHGSNGKAGDSRASGDAAPDSRSGRTAAGDAYASLSVKELKQELAKRGVSLPPGVAEKSELIDLVKKAERHPLRDRSGPAISAPRSGSSASARDHLRQGRERQPQPRIRRTTATTPAASPTAREEPAGHETHELEFKRWLDQRQNTQAVITEADISGMLGQTGRSHAPIKGAKNKSRVKESANVEIQIEEV